MCLLMRERHNQFKKDGITSSEESSRRWILQSVSKTKQCGVLGSFWGNQFTLHSWGGKDKHDLFYGNDLLAELISPLLLPRLGEEGLRLYWQRFNCKLNQKLRDRARSLSEFTFPFLNVEPGCTPVTTREWSECTPLQAEGSLKNQQIVCTRPTE